MADQKRWFKVWTSINGDPHFSELALEDIGRWSLLGAYTALHGQDGRLVIPGEGKALCQALRLPDLEAVKSLVSRLPNVTHEEGENRYGGIVVTFKNWRKYQIDSTAAERMKTLRSKRRREEKREEGKPPLTPPTDQNGAHSRPAAGYSVEEAVTKYQPLEAYRRIDVRQAAMNCLNWCVTRRRELTEKRLVNWLNTEAMKAAGRSEPDPSTRYPRPPR